MIDKLIEGIKQTKCPVCVGLDTMHTYLPEEFEADEKKPLRSIGDALFDFNREIIDSINDIVPSSNMARRECGPSKKPLPMHARWDWW